MHRDAGKLYTGWSLYTPVRAGVTAVRGPHENDGLPSYKLGFSPGSWQSLQTPRPSSGQEAGGGATCPWRRPPVRPASWERHSPGAEGSHTLKGHPSLGSQISPPQNTEARFVRIKPQAAALWCVAAEAKALLVSLWPLREEFYLLLLFLKEGPLP